jgi:uncharacterized protein YggU (UPF0235/DUF167 family)
MPLDVRQHRLGSTLRLAVRPGAPRTRAAGEHGGALKLAVAAPPERGRANAEALRYLAAELGLPATRLELLAGELSRDKVLLCRGLAPADLLAAAQKLAGAGSARRKGS